MSSQRSPRVWVLAVLVATLVSGWSGADAQDVPPVDLLARGLTGWKADRTEANVRSGILTIRAGDGWLQFDRVLANFVVAMDVRLASGDGSGGIFVRSWPTFDAKLKVPSNGYRVVAARPSAATSGRVFGHGRSILENRFDVATPNSVPADQGWHRYEIECLADSLKVTIDGKVVSEVSGVRNPQGYLALRADAGTMEFKDVRLRGLTLPKSTPPAGVFAPNADLRPRVRFEGKPQYTADAMDRRIQGTVWISAVIQADGTPTDLSVTRSLDPEFGLDQMALNAAAQWRFFPAMRDGQPVPVQVTIELQFFLR